MKYKIVSDINYAYLEMDVSDWLEDGWELYGPLVVRGDILHQAMVLQSEVDQSEN